jgi:hypothetical protein
LLQHRRSFQSPGNPAAVSALINQEDLGQWLYVPSFRTVCLFQDSVHHSKDYKIFLRSSYILPLHAAVLANTGSHKNGVGFIYNILGDSSSVTVITETPTSLNLSIPHYYIGNKRGVFIVFPYGNL